MKLTRIISLLLVLAMMSIAFASCNLWGTKEPEDTTTTVVEKTDKYDTITVAEAIEIAKAETSNEPTTRYYIRATIVKVSNPTYGEMTIADETGEIYVYGTYSYDGALRYSEMEDRPVKGDEVLLHCTLNMFNDTPQVKNARIIEFTPAAKEDIDVSDYTEMTVADAREAALGTKISVTGVVARITYANGMKPSGVYIVDGTNSIYVYDGDIAGQVSIGNKITVLGEKDYWILDTETNNAKKYGYKGCCQISSATLYENDKAVNNIDFSWCEEKSIKDILEIPVTENVTTTIYKTTALIEKKPESGYVNYYFYDLDGTTGAYTYTQCNGSDFAWLDAFDGKICTVYLSPMNAKSTASNCYFRFLPVSVIDEGFEFDVSKAPEYAIEYHVINQFLPVYTGNPLKELPTSISSSLLGFDNVVISYESDNEDAVYFTVNTPGTVTLNCGENGVANVTITATYGENTHSETVKITVIDPSKIEHIDVGTAINSAVGTKVTVRGIVGPSLVNQSGFYLIDETGTIAVRIQQTDFENGLAIGQDVFVEGTISITKDGGGQLCIDDASIIANLFGKNDYSTDSFITDATIEDISKIADSYTATTSVYVVTAKVEKVSKQQGSYTNVTFYVGNVLLYSGNAGQYGWLEQFFAEGETSATLTVELALCDWNAKGLKGCVLSVITEDGKVYNELNFK